MVQVGAESENGWRPARLDPASDLLVWKTVPGTTVSLQVMRGLPEVFLPAWAADWNAYIEPLRDADSASYTPTNSVATSNHLNATAEDLNWNDHPFHADSFSDDKKATVHAMVDFYEGWMFWAGDWESPLDQMHSQMGYNTWNRNTAALDFIARKIRSDGYSTFRRGPLAGDPTPPDTATALPPDANRPDTWAQVLYDAVPVIDEARAAKLVPLIMPALRLAQCDTVNRIAMWLAQIGHESAGFVYTEEIDKGDGGATERWKYLGRTWIQITWLSNYLGFSEWCYGLGMVPSPTYFGDNPATLADDRWAGLGPAWYWTVARPQINALCDNGDLLGVTKAINGGTNGLPDRTDRYQQALALGERLLLLTQTTQAPTDQEMVTLADVTRAEWDSLVSDVQEIRAQLDGQWPQNGNDMDAAKTLDQRKAAGEKLTVNDLLCWLKNHVSTHKTPTP
jgi:predicted chitinase